MSHAYNVNIRKRMEKLVRAELASRPDIVEFCISMAQNLEDKIHPEIMTEPQSSNDKRDIDERVAQSLLTAIRMAYTDIKKFYKKD